MSIEPVLASLNELGVEHRSGFWGVPPDSNHDGHLVRVVRNGDVLSSGVANKESCPSRRFSGRQLNEAQLQRGDILVTTSGEPGKSAIWDGTPGFAASNFIRRLRAPSSLIAKYLFYFLRSQQSREAFARHSRGVAIKNLSGMFWDELCVPIYGIEDIEAILNAIESYLSRLDAVAASLGRVQAKLISFRASVLKAAFDGNLVPNESLLASSNRHGYESGSALLERVRSERRSVWEQAERQRLRANGKVGNIDKWKGKYLAPPDIDTNGLPVLPDGWCWTSLSSLIVDGPQNGMYVPKARYGKGTPIIRIDDYQVDRSRSSSELQRVDLSVDDIRKFCLSSGDIVLNRVNSPSHLGKTLTIEPRHLPAVFESNMMRFRIASCLSPHYLHYYLTSAQGKKRLIAGAKWAVNQASINQDDVGNTAVPLPPVAEQLRIVAAVDGLFSAQLATASIVGRNAKRAERLRQAVLKWAFEGKLVHQDAVGKRAERLLTDIQSGRVKRPQHDKARRQKIGDTK